MIKSIEISRSRYTEQIGIKYISKLSTFRILEGELTWAEGTEITKAALAGSLLQQRTSLLTVMDIRDANIILKEL